MDPFFLKSTNRVANKVSWRHFLIVVESHPHITLETNLAADLQNLSGSPVHLEKAVMNLLINSYEAIENQGSISITTENKYVDTPIKGYDTTVPGNYVVLVISDTGMGIPEDNLAKIFEPFYDFN